MQKHLDLFQLMVAPDALQMKLIETCALSKIDNMSSLHDLFCSWVILVFNNFLVTIDEQRSLSPIIIEGANEQIIISLLDLVK